MGGHRRGRRPEDTPASTTTTSEFTAVWYLQKQKRENLPYWEYYQINEHELYIELELLLLQQQLLLAGHSISSSSPTSSSNREDTTKSNLYYSVCSCSSYSIIDPIGIIGSIIIIILTNLVYRQFYRVVLDLVRLSVRVVLIWFLLLFLLLLLLLALPLVTATRINFILNTHL